MHGMGGTKSFNQKCHIIFNSLSFLAQLTFYILNMKIKILLLDFSVTLAIRCFWEAINSQSSGGGEYIFCVSTLKEKQRLKQVAICSVAGARETLSSTYDIVKYKEKGSVLPQLTGNQQRGRK